MANLANAMCTSKVRLHVSLLSRPRGIHSVTITRTVVFLSKLFECYLKKLSSSSARSMFRVLHKSARHKFIVTITFYASTL